MQPETPTITPGAVRGGFRHDIQGLRAVAVLLVVLYHANLLVGGGFVGVDVFFVVSGFVISGQLRGQVERTGRVDLRRFYTRRARRLLPAAALTSVVTLVLTAVATSPIREQQFTARTARAAALFVANLFLFRSGGGYFDPGEERNAFLHTWTLSVEEQFYLLLPALIVVVIWVVGRRRRSAVGPVAATVAVASVVSFALGWMLTTGTGPIAEHISAADRFAFYGPATRAWEFGAGVVLAFAGPRLVRVLVPPVRLLLAAGGVIAVIGAAVGFDRYTPFPGVAALVPVIGAVALVAAGIDGRTLLTPLLEWPPLVWIGDRSYGWYLWHWPAIVLAGAIWPTNEVALAMAALLSIIPAALSYHFVEQPVRRNPRIEGWRVLALAAGCIVLPVLVASLVLVGANRRWGIAVPADWTDRRLAVTARCDAGQSTVWPEDRCRFGGSASNGTILLLGDSHAASASDGVVAAASSLGYDTAVWYNSGCPFLSGHAPVGDPTCRRWQTAATALARSMHPDLVIIANRSTGYTLPSVPRNDRWLTIGRSDGARPSDREEALDAWAAGLDGALDAVHSTGAPVLVFEVVPEFPVDFSSRLSLLRPDPGAPTISRAEVDERRGPVLARERRVVAAHPDDATFDPATTLCSGGRCAATGGGRWRYMDRQHLTPVGSKLLSPALATAITRLLGK